MNYTPEQLKFIKDNAKLPRSQLAEMFNQCFGVNKSRAAISALCIYYGWEQDKSLLPSQLYSEDELEFLKQNCLLPRQELTALFNKEFNQKRTVSAIRAVCKRYGWLTDSALWNFQKGSIPANKGTKGLSRANRTSFKKGDTPHNLRPIGSETLRDEYIWIKVSENHWIMKHIHIWEQAHGPIPSNHMITFLDGNRLNCSLKNLLLITQREHCYINKNGYARYPHELKKPILGLTRLKLKLHDLGKGQ